MNHINSYERHPVLAVPFGRRMLAMLGARST